MKHRQIAFHARDCCHQVLPHVRGHCLGRFVLHSSKTFTVQCRDFVTVAQKLCHDVKISLLLVGRALELSNILVISRAALLTGFSEVWIVGLSSWYNASSLMSVTSDCAFVMCM